MSTGLSPEAMIARGFRPPEWRALLDAAMGAHLQGTLDAARRLDVLVDAFARVRAARSGARLLLVGGGPMADALQAQAQASPAAAAIRFVGRVPHDQVERYYALADIMAYPRKRSRLTDLVTPLKPLEAMAQGRLLGLPTDMLPQRGGAIAQAQQDHAAIGGLGDQAVADFPQDFTNWGFGTFAGSEEIHPSVVWAKFEALAEGARLATERLWKRRPVAA